MKTTWQKIYSFFGFWTYTEWKDITTTKQIYPPCPKYSKRIVLYWCLFPWFKYYRKINLISWKE